MVNIDTVRPKVIPSTVSITSNNPIPANGGLKWAKKGQSIILDFDTQERVFEPQVSIRGISLFPYNREGDSSGMLWRVEYPIFSDMEYLKSLMGSSNIKLWLDAENIDGMNNMTIGNGNAVNIWKDLSDYGNDVACKLILKELTYYKDLVKTKELNSIAE